MPKNVSLGLMIAGLVLIVIAIAEHVALTAKLIPHLAIGLGVLAVILLVVGAIGFFQPGSSR